MERLDRIYEICYRRYAAEDSSKLITFSFIWLVLLSLMFKAVRWDDVTSELLHLIITSLT